MTERGEALLFFMLFAFRLRIFNISFSFVKNNVKIV